MAGFLLPPQNHPAREMLGDMANLVEVLDRRNLEKMPAFEQAIRIGRRTLAGNPEAKRAFIICLRADDERWLISVGPRGGWRKEWNFGAGK